MTDDQLQRYSRHIGLAGFGASAQQRLLDGSVLIVGVGGLGSPAALYLAAAGVGRIGLMDADSVALSNLQRQIIHHTTDLGRMKVESARSKLVAANPDVTVELWPTMLTAENAREIIGRYDFTICATDNLASKYLINDTCVALGKGFSYGGVQGFGGQSLTHLPGTADLRSIFGGPEDGAATTEAAQPSPDEAEASAKEAAEASADAAEPLAVLGPAVGVIGTIQATEAVKVLSGVGQPLTNRLLVFDALSMTFEEIRV